MSCKLPTTVLTVHTGSIRFFTVTPVGRILNRFSKDIETIDGSLMSSLETVIVYVASLIGAVVSAVSFMPVVER
jgi:ABC-type multidrug transport system fused ATPase/permease subunit